jgi:hypothetical protein
MNENTTADRLTLQCPQCQARLRASRQLVGRECPCPRCRTRVLVRLPVPSDADIALTPDDTRSVSRPRWY